MTWPNVTLGEIFDIARGGSPRPIDDYITDAPDGVNWISIKDASNSSKYITKTAKKILPSGVSRSREVKPGDFLLTNSMSFGRPYILRTAGCIHDGWLVLSGDDEVVDQDYFYYLLGSDFTYRKFASLAAGAVVKNLNIDLVKTVSVPLPPIAEQRRIAAILDKADALRAKRREAIAKLDQLLQSVFLDMFGDPVTNPKGWPTVRIDTICSKVIDCPHSTPNWSESGVICLRTSNLGKGNWSWVDTRYVNESEYIERSKRGEIESGDIVLSREGTVGVLAVVESGMRLCMGQRLVQLRANAQKATPYFLMHLLLHDLAPERISRLMAGSTSRHLNVKELRGLPVNLPPLSKQQKFSAIAKRIGQQKQTVQRSADQLETLFATLQHRAFTGTL